MVFNDDIPIAIWPYYLKSRWGQKYVTLPPLTPYLGPMWFNTVGLKNASRLSKEKSILTKLSEQLPKTLLFLTHSYPFLDNLLYLRWRGFKEEVRYTYHIDLSEKKPLWENLDSKQRNIIRKAKSSLTVQETDDIALFYSLNKQSFERQGLSIPYSFAFLEKMDGSLKDRRRRKIYIATDNSGQQHGAIYTAFDHKTVYLLAIGSHSGFRDQGSIPLLIWSALEDYQQTHEVFDFEGSMIPSIEEFFRSFGGSLQKYSKIYKASSRWAEIILRMFNRL